MGAISNTYISSMRQSDMESSNSKYNDKDPLKEHDLVRKLSKNGKLQPYIRINGYIGKTDNNDLVRLYLNLNFDEFMEVKRSDVLHAETLTRDDIEMGGTCIWIKKDAEVEYVKTQSTKQQAQFLEGEIVEKQLDLEMGGYDTPQVPDTILGNCWKTRIGCRTISPFECIKTMVIRDCASVPLSKCPSLIRDCASVLISKCRSLLIICPTIHIINCYSLPNPDCIKRTTPLAGCYDIPVERELVNELRQEIDKLKSKINRLENKETE